mgnify:FL=1
MANAIVSRELGDEYQQLVFWKYALDMLSGKYDIKRIRFEDDEIKSFDDVVIEYSKPQKYRDSSIEKEYYQVKYHVRDDDFFTIDNLLDPSFINATKNSLLDKVVAAYKKMDRDEFTNCTFIIYSVWDISQNDELYSLVNNSDSTIRLDLLFDGTKTAKSKMGGIRKKLCDKLKVTEEDLYVVLKQLRICSRKEKMDDLISIINSKLEYQGLRVIRGSQYTNPYLQIINKLYQAGNTVFDKTYLEHELYNEGLYESLKEESIIAVRSFIKHTENIENESNKLLKMEDYFEDRFLKKDQSWNNIYKNLQEFLSEACVESKAYYLQLEANTSIAFMAGQILDIKAGKDITPIQRTEYGVNKWRKTIYCDNYPEAIYVSETIDDQNVDVALVIEFARNIYQDVLEYIEEDKLSIGRVIRFKLPISGSASVQDGAHAWKLANQIKDIVDSRKLKEKRNTLHIFSACPNALMFLLGRYSLSFGKTILYEYDFMKQRTCTYYPTISLPYQEEL